jgi:hypothetical protein
MAEQEIERRVAKLEERVGRVEQRILGHLKGYGELVGQLHSAVGTLIETLEKFMGEFEE